MSNESNSLVVGDEKTYLAILRGRVLFGMVKPVTLSRVKSVKCDLQGSGDRKVTNRVTWQAASELFFI